MKSIHATGFRKQMQKGFTLVELAIVLVIAGLILTGVLKGTDSINKAKAERAVADLRGLQGQLMEYQKRTGRLPGDCNNDGVIGFAPAIGVYISGNAKNTLDSAEADRILPQPATLFDGTAQANCLTSAAQEIGANVVWNDMRRNNIVDPQRLPAELAKNVNGSYYEVGNMHDGATTVTNANVIVVYSIPVWLAEAIDASIDGVVNYSGGISAANSGRIRRWDGNATVGTLATAPANQNGSVLWAAGTYTDGFMKTGETRDSLISISYQFDVNKLPN